LNYIINIIYIQDIIIYSAFLKYVLKEGYGKIQLIKSREDF